MLFDLLIAAVLLLFAVNGYQRGFAKSVISLVRFILSVGLSYLFYPALAQFFMSNMEWPSKIEAWVANTLANSFGILPASKQLTAMIVSAAAFVVIMISVSIAVSVIGSLLNAAAQLPILKELNKLAGILAGLAKGALTAIALSTALFIIGYSGMPAIKSMCESSALVKTFYLGNLIKGIQNTESGGAAWITRLASTQ